MEETKTAYAYHYQIVNEGIDPDSNEYYDELNQRIFSAYIDYEQIISYLLYKRRYVCFYIKSVWKMDWKDRYETT